MRISIWQQFSSNHSADFTIVGTFESEERAAQVAEQLRYIIQTIVAFWKQLNTQEREAWHEKDDNGAISITPVERDLSRQYQVEWSKGALSGLPCAIDWIADAPESAERSVVQFGKHIFMENQAETWVSSQPFESIMKKFGGQVVGNYEGDIKTIVLDLSCLAPDEQTAEQLMADIKTVYWPDELIDDVYIEGIGARFTDSYVVRDGLRFRYTLAMNEVNQLRFLLAYLDEHGCKAIRYEFSQGD